MYSLPPPSTVSTKDIRPIYNEETMAEVQLTTECNVFATGQQRAEQPEFNNEGEEAKNKTYDKGRNSKPRVIPSTRSQSTTNDCKPKPKIDNRKSRNWLASKSSCVTTKIVPLAEHSSTSRNFSDTKHFVCLTCQKCVFNANHDACVTKFLNEVNSRAKVPSHKTTNRNKPVKQISVPKKQERQISTGYRWIPTRKIFTSSTTTVDSEPPHGSNTDITNLHECIQNLDSSAGTSINVQEEQTLDLNVGSPFNLKKERIKVWIKENVIFRRPRLHGTTLIEEISGMFGDEWNKGIMPTKIELTLEQSQQGVSNDVLDSYKDGDGDTSFQQIRIH
ncbi:hypothetical protein Tco_0105664 [Tanacetum coccineum]